MDITLFHIKELKENGRIRDYRNVTVSINSKQELIVYCCDINDTAKSMFSDSGAEFYLILNQQSKNKLATILLVTQDVTLPQDEEKINQKLLNSIHNKFGEKYFCFENLMRFFKEEDIKYRYDRW